MVNLVQLSSFVLFILFSCFWQLLKRESIVAEFHGNLRGSEFTLYEGELPRKVHVNHSTNSSRPATAHSFDIRESRQEESENESVESLDKPVTYREDLVSITYLPNPKSSDKKARKIKILLPIMENETERLEIQRIGRNHNLAKCTNGALHGVMEFWSKDFDNEDEVSVKEEGENDDLQKGQPIGFKFKSIKNCQIVHAERDDYIILESGRLSDREFSLEIRFPLCPLQLLELL